MTWGLNELGPFVLMLFSVGLGEADPDDGGVPDVDGLMVSVGLSWVSELQATPIAAIVADRLATAAIERIRMCRP